MWSHHREGLEHFATHQMQYGATASPWSHAPGCSRALVLHRHRRGRCCKVRDATEHATDLLLCMWDVRHHHTYPHSATGHLQQWVAQAGLGGHSRRLFWGTYPLMRIPSPALWCSSIWSQYVAGKHLLTLWAQKSAGCHWRSVATCCKEHIAAAFWVSLSRQQVHKTRNHV